MQGNQLMQPQHRVLLASALFALGAGALFLVVWYLPDIAALFVREQVEKTQEEVADEKKMQILRELEQSRAEASGAPEMTSAEKNAAIEAVSIDVSGEGPTEREKLDTLDSLN